MKSGGKSCRASSGVDLLLFGTMSLDSTDAPENGKLSAQKSLHGNGDGNIGNILHGRTPDGVTFPVPQTHDMLHNLFSHFPPSHKTHSVVELVTLGVVAMQIIVFLVACYGGALGTAWRAYFLFSFLVWRAGYNAGLGWLLQNQSSQRLLVHWCRSSGYFDRDTADKSPNGKRVYRWLRAVCSKKLGADYDFDVRSYLICAGLMAIGGSD
jgi:hypothetical protein